MTPARADAMEMRMRDERKSGKPRRKDTGNGLALGIGLGLALGAGIGAAMDDIAFGMCIGIAFGTAMGLTGGGADEKDDRIAQADPKESVAALIVIVEREEERENLR